MNGLLYSVRTLDIEDTSLLLQIFEMCYEVSTLEDPLKDTLATLYIKTIKNKKVPTDQGQPSNSSNVKSMSLESGQSSQSCSSDYRSTAIKLEWKLQLLNFFFPNPASMIRRFLDFFVSHIAAINIRDLGEKLQNIDNKTKCVLKIGHLLRAL